MPVLLDENGQPKALMVDYPPNEQGVSVRLPSQLAFFQAFRKFKGVALTGGFGSGKTITLCIKAMMMLMKYPRCRGMLTNVTFTQLERTTISTFFALFPEQYIGKYNEVKKTLVCFNGSILYFGSTTNPETLKGPNLLFFGMDEGSDSLYGAYLMLIGRLRKDVTTKFPDDAFCYWICSNPAGKNWVWKHFYSPEKQSKHIGFVATTAENTFLSPDFEKDLREQYTPEEAASYLDASFDVFAGQIFSEFKRMGQNANVIEPFDIPAHWHRYRGVDFGVTHPSGCLWVAEDEEGNLYVYCEWRRSGVNPKEMAEDILALSMDEEYRYSVADYAGKKIDQTSKTSPFQMVKEYGLDIVEAIKHDKLFTISRTNMLFKHGNLFVFSNCTMLIEEIAQYQWEKQLVTGALKPTPKKINDDLVDPLLYVVAGRPDLRALPVDPRTVVREVEVKKHVAKPFKHKVVKQWT